VGVGDTGIEFEPLVESLLRFSSWESGKGQGSGETRWPLVDSCRVVICNVIAEVHSGQPGYYVDNFGPVENGVTGGGSYVSFHFASIRPVGSSSIINMNTQANSGSKSGTDPLDRPIYRSNPEDAKK
jgi:hypothetical protein